MKGFYLFIYFISFLFYFIYYMLCLHIHTTSSSNRYVSLIVFVTCYSDIVHTQKHAVDVCKYWISKYTLFQSWKWINETEMFLLYLLHNLTFRSQRKATIRFYVARSKWSEMIFWEEVAKRFFSPNWWFTFFLIWAFHHSQNTYQII